MRIYKRLGPDRVFHARILDAVREQKKSKQWTKEGGEFIPLPRTW